ncbi:hypothetical protein B0H21DRAFT_703667, partial [Amylocystis lapponica]
TGKRDGYTAIDRAQEARIKDIKVTNRSQGPSINWAYFRKLHPAIPVIQTVSHHMEAEFTTWKRYKAHTTPNDVRGISILQKAYTASHVHDTQPGRKVAESEIAKDFYNDGLLNLAKPITRWVDVRTFERSMANNWEPIEENRNDDEMMVDVDDEPESD